jgi:hypothetical protein
MIHSDYFILLTLGFVPCSKSLDSAEHNDC